MSDAPKLIECSFSLLDTGRRYTGRHRKYVIENAREICYSPATRESIRLREAFGYYGHGRRILGGRDDLTLAEVGVITLPNGEQAMVSNIPSNITVAFDVSEGGQVTHTQEILDTETGKIVAGLHTSRVGGFSWACPGTDGKQARPTMLSGFSGFDYVLQPGFSANRGYVLESAQGNLILESVAAVVGNETRAEQLVAGWKLDLQNRVADMENAIFESEGRYAEAMMERKVMAENLGRIEEERDTVREALAQEKAHFKGILESIADSLPFFIPEEVMHEMLEGDFTRARGIFESAKRFDFSQFPIDKVAGGEQISVFKEQPTEGSTAYGFNLDV